MDSSAYGFWSRDRIPIFAPDRITIQDVRHLLPSFNAALIGWVEAHRTAVAEKNRLCPPTPPPSRPEDWAPMLVGTWQTSGVWRAERDLQSWMKASRLNLGVIPQMRDDPMVRESMDRLRSYSGPAIDRVLNPSDAPSTN